MAMKKKIEKFPVDEIEIIYKDGIEKYNLPVFLKAANHNISTKIFAVYEGGCLKVNCYGYDDYTIIHNKGWSHYDNEPMELISKETFIEIYQEAFDFITAKRLELLPILNALEPEQVLSEMIHVSGTK